MDEMFKMMDKMMANMSGTDCQVMVKRMLDKCFEGMSSEEKEEVLGKTASPGSDGGDPGKGDSWKMMPNMLMSMMGMTCVSMMQQMMQDSPTASGKGGSPGMGMGKGMGSGMMGSGGPMQMMRKMMGMGGADPAQGSAESCSKEEPEESG